MDHEALGGAARVGNNPPVDRWRLRVRCGRVRRGGGRTRTGGVAAVAMYAGAGWAAVVYEECGSLSRWPAGSDRRVERGGRWCRGCKAHPLHWQVMEPGGRIRTMRTQVVPRFEPLRIEADARMKWRGDREMIATNAGHEFRVGGRLDHQPLRQGARLRFDGGHGEMCGRGATPADREHLVR